MVDTDARPPHSPEETLRLVLVHAVVGRKLFRVVHHLVDVAHQLQVAVGRQFVRSDQRPILHPLLNQRLNIGRVLRAADGHHGSGGALALPLEHLPQHDHDPPIRVEREGGRFDLLPVLAVLGRHGVLVFLGGFSFLAPLALLAGEVPTVDLDHIR